LIKNRTTLEKFHGVESSLVISAIESAIKSVDPGDLVKRSLSFKNKTLVVRGIDGKSFKLAGFKNVYVVGAGKAAVAMAAATVSVFGGRIAGGAINAPKGTTTEIEGIVITHASHPVPNNHGIAGTKRILKILENARPEDLVIAVLSGGGSALMPLPAKGITLKDKQDATSALLASGATIHEINAARKHLSAVKGGQLVRHTGARMLSLVLSDVVGDDMAVIASGPTFPDSTTFSDAWQVMKKYGIIKTRAARHIARGAGGLEEETPKPGDGIFGRVANVLIGNNWLACKGAIDYLRRKKVATQYIGSNFDVRAQDFGKFMSNIANDIKSKAPFALVAGGETTVRLGKKSGIGGRNQEAALVFALSCVKATAAFIGTDGIDGNSDAAGALVSEKSIALAEKINAKAFLARHDSYHALKKMGSLIFTGYTGTNVNDITIVYKQSQ
jgi:glycerate 2-kinase